MTIEIFLLNIFGGEGGRGQNAWQNGSFCLDFENSRKGPIVKASNER